MNKQTTPTYFCVNRRCTRVVVLERGLCQICSDAVPASIGTSPADRIAARRAATKRNLELQQEADRIRAAMAGPSAKFGSDFVGDGILAAVLRGSADPIEEGRLDARGKRSNAFATAKRRAGIEMKYADAWVPSDPTGDRAATNVDGTATSALLLAADTFARPVAGRRGFGIDFTSMGAALNYSPEVLEVLTRRELLATGQYGLKSDKRTRATRATRAKANNVTEAWLAKEEGFGLADRAPKVRPAVMVAETKRARILEPVVGTGRIK